MMNDGSKIYVPGDEAKAVNQLPASRSDQFFGCDLLTLYVTLNLATPAK